MSAKTSRSALLRRRLAQRVAEALAGGALRVGRVELAAHRIEPRLQALHAARVCTVGIPALQLRAHALQRARAALVERALRLPGLVEDARGGLPDARGVLRRQVDQGAQVAGAPLQPRRRADALVPGLRVPAQCGVAVAAPARVAG